MLHVAYLMPQVACNYFLGILKPIQTYNRNDSQKTTTKKLTCPPMGIYTAV